MAHHGPKITIIVKQRQAILDTPSPDQKINCLSNSNTARAQGAEVACCGDGDRIADHRHDVKTAEQTLDVPGVAVGFEPLQDFAKHQIADGNLADPEE